MKYVALLRGINVGGKNKVKMSDLKISFENLGLKNVLTYINSGNVIFESDETNTEALQETIQNELKKSYDNHIATVVVSQKQLQQILENTPKGWAEGSDWKYNFIFLVPPYDMKEVISAIGELKPEIEAVVPGNGVLYQSMSIKLFGRTTTGKLASNPIYKKMTIRNNNTTNKLLDLMLA